MTSESVLQLLTYANGIDCTVRLVLRDGTEVIGVPSSIDTHPTAFEAYLRPTGDPDTEIAISLGAIISAEMI